MTSKFNKGMRSSASAEWSTPQDFFDKLNEEFGFTIDVCAGPSNAKCKRYITKEEDGLNRVWTGRCFMNPGYGSGIINWVKKAAQSAHLGRAEVVVCLLPARTDTTWWQDWIGAGWNGFGRRAGRLDTADEVRLHRGRLRFGDAKNSAPFPSAVVIYRGR